MSDFDVVREALEAANEELCGEHHIGRWGNEPGCDENHEPFVSAAAALGRIEAEMRYMGDSLAAGGPTDDEARQLFIDEHNRAYALETQVQQLTEELAAARRRIEELNQLQAASWTECQMAKGTWTFTLNINRDDGEEVLAHELAHVVQRFRWPDDEVHSERHAALVETLYAVLDPQG